MNWTKKSIEKAIKEARLGMELTAQILIALKEFEHHKQVNKKFTDRMKAMGCHAYIQKDDHSTTLSISKGFGYGEPKAEFWIYVSHVMTKNGLTWERIRTEIDRHGFEKRLIDSKERLELIDKEAKEAQELLELVKAKKFKCFCFDKAVWEIESAVKAAQCNQD